MITAEGEVDNPEETLHISLLYRYIYVYINCVQKKTPPPFVPQYISNNPKPIRMKFISCSLDVVD